jgi:hypothetical protein
MHASTSNAIADLIHIVRAICGTPVEPDGVIFDPASVVGERIMNNALLQGVGVKCLAILGTAQITVPLDVSYGNVITPAAIDILFPTLLGAPEPRLRAYPFETVIAEKLQALVFLGSINDRLKDFYDLWLLSQQIDLAGQSLCTAIRATFMRRGTPIPTEVPAALTLPFADAKQLQWRAFLNKSVPEAGPVADFSLVLVQLRKFLMPPLFAAAHNADFSATWTAGKAWTP